MEYHELISELEDDNNPIVIDALEIFDPIYSALKALSARIETLEKLVAEYQDELIPGYRERAEKAERERDAAVEQLRASKNTQWPTCWSAYY